VPDDEDDYEEASDAGQEQRGADGRGTRTHGRSGPPEAREERRQDDNGSADGAGRVTAAAGRDTGSGGLAGDPAGRAGPGEHAEARRRYEESLTIDRRAHGGGAADQEAERVSGVAAAARVASRVRKLSASPSNIHLIPEGSLAQKPGATPIATPAAAAAGPKVRQKDAPGRSSRRAGEESRAAAEPPKAKVKTSSRRAGEQSDPANVPAPAHSRAAPKVPMQSPPRFVQVVSPEGNTRMLVGTADADVQTSGQQCVRRSLRRTARQLLACITIQGNFRKRHASRYNALRSSMVRHAEYGAGARVARTCYHAQHGMLHLSHAARHATIVDYRNPPRVGPFVRIAPSEVSSAAQHV
jgi:hypothetical protein